MSDYLQRLVARTQAPAASLQPAEARPARAAETDPFENPAIAPAEPATSAPSVAGEGRAPLIPNSFLPTSPTVDPLPLLPGTREPGSRRDEPSRAAEPRAVEPTPLPVNAPATRPRERVRAAAPAAAEIRIERAAPMLTPPAVPAAPAAMPVPPSGARTPPALAPAAASKPFRASRTEAVPGPRTLEPQPSAPAPLSAPAPEPRISIGRITVEVTEPPQPRAAPPPVAPHRPASAPRAAPTARDEGGSLKLRFGLGQM